MAALPALIVPIVITASSERPNSLELIYERPVIICAAIVIGSTPLLGIEP